MEEKFLSEDRRNTTWRTLLPVEYKRNMAYTLIEFRVDKSYEAVPTSWLEFMDTGTYCFFPHNKQRKHIVQGETPDRERWTRYPVKVLELNVSYERGQELIRRISSKGDMNSSANEGRKRKGMEPDRYTPDEDTEDEEEDEEEYAQRLSQPKKSKSNVKSHFKPHTKISLPAPPTYIPGVQGEIGKKTSGGANKYVTKTTTTVNHTQRKKESRIDQEEIIRSRNDKDTQRQKECRIDQEEIIRSRTDKVDNSKEKTNQLPENHNEDLIDNVYENDNTTDSYDNFRRHVLINLSTLIDNQRKIMNMMRVISMSSVADGVESDDTLVKTPCNTIQELLNLNSELGDDRTLRKLVKYFTTLAQDTLSGSIIRIMNIIAYRHVWGNFSLVGQKGKSKLRPMAIYTAVSRAVRAIHKEASDRKVSTGIGDYLKHSPERAKTQVTETDSTSHQPDEEGSPEV